MDRRRLVTVWDILREFGPWSCWRQRHGWIGCLREPKHKYPS